MIRVVVVLGAGVGLGLIMMVAALRPAPPRLDAVLARLDGHDPAYADDTGRPGLLRRALVPRRLTAWLAGHLTVPGTDLALLGMSPERLAAEKAAAGTAGLVVPALFAGGLAAIGSTVPVSVPAGAAIIAAVLLFLVPDLLARQNASRRRDDFMLALSAYFDLVRLAFAAGTGPNEAFEQAPRHSGSWAFRRIAHAVTHAQDARIPPWQALARLGAEIGVHELADLADLADLAETEGTQIVPIITAYTEQMRHRRLTGQRANSNARTTTMTIPIATIGLAFVLLLAFPQAYLLVTG